MPIITLWRGLRFSHGQRLSVNWDELCTFLSPDPPPPFYGEGYGEARDPISYTGHPGWSPCEFAEDLRRKDHIQAVSFLTLEHDAGSINVDQALSTLSTLTVDCLVITTKSHTPAHPRLRFVLNLSRSVTLVERETLYQWALGLGLDLAHAESRDPSRFWFTTCRGLDPDSGKAYRLMGQALDVDDILSRTVPAAPAPPSNPTPGPFTGDVTPYVQSALDRAARAICEAGKGNRHSTLAKEAYALGGLVGGGHLSRGLAESALRAAVDSAWPPSDPDRDRDGYRTLKAQLTAGIAHPRSVAAPVSKGSAMPQPSPAADVTPLSHSHLRAVNPDESPDTRPVIFVKKGEIPTMINAAINALSLSPGDVYTRDSDLVHVSHAPLADDDGFPSGAPKMYTITPPGLTERLAKCAQWIKRTQTKDTHQWIHTPADPPALVVQGVIARRHWPSLRPIAGIVQAPTLRPDGSLITVKGYDPQTRMLYIPAEHWPSLPINPTHEDAYQSLCTLYDAFVDFPWENEEGIYVAIAAVLTVIARPAIIGAVPVFIFDANTPGSGKTLVADTIATIATGREAGRHSYPSDPKNGNEEVAKVLTGYAIGGAQVLCWDNLSPDCLFGGPALESVSTARDTASFRILGKSENVTIPWRTVMLATGNNVAITRDLERRSLVPRFIARWETADSRPLDTFRHPDRFGRLLAWTRSERITLVSAALTLLRAYHLAGRPSQGQRWASFEEWTELIPSALVWSGGKSPLNCRPADTGRVSPEREALAVILRDWPRLDTDNTGLTLRSALATLYPERRPGDGPSAPDSFDELRDALEVLAPSRNGRSPDATRLAGAFRRLRQVSLAGHSLETSTGRSGVSRWTVRAS